MSELLKPDPDLQIKTTAGSVANLRLMKKDFLDLSIVQSDILARDSQEDAENVSYSAVAGLYTEALQIVVRQDSGIREVEDLKGRTVSLGEEESGVRKNAEERLEKKIEDFNSGRYTFRFAEFGCRRRLSREWASHVVHELRDRLVNRNMVGTSNVYLAKKFGLTPVGTYAHEFVQMYQGIDSIPLAYTNRNAMEDWYDYYRGDNGTALTDTITTGIFLKDFNRAMVNNYSGVRHDSGDPFEWGERMIAHYEKYGVDPRTKLLLFSDGLDFDRAQELYDHFSGRAKVSFGIGTFITNDTGVEPLNIVIKLQYVNGRPVAKLSDTHGKEMSQDDGYLDYLKKAVDFRMERERDSGLT